MESMVERYRIEFEKKFEEELSRNRSGEYHCLKALQALEETLEQQGYSPEERIDALNRLAREMVEYSGGRLSQLARRSYDRWHDEEHIDVDRYEAVREELFFFDHCFKNIYEELERFNLMSSESSIDRAVLADARGELVRFEQLIQTYVRLLELRIRPEER
jgi:hypothetical protein